MVWNYFISCNKTYSLYHSINGLLDE